MPGTGIFLRGNSEAGSVAASVCVCVCVCAGGGGLWDTSDTHHDGLPQSLLHACMLHLVNNNILLGPLCYKLITIVNCYLEAGLTCFVYCPKALYLIIFIVWHSFCD